MRAAAGCVKAYRERYANARCTGLVGHRLPASRDGKNATLPARSGPHPPEKRTHDDLQCLKKHGQRLDLEIAEETRVPLTTVRKGLTELSATGSMVMCRLTRYEGDKTIEAWQCRVSGDAPAPAAGRKPKVAA